MTAAEHPVRFAMGVDIMVSNLHQRLWRSVQHVLQRFHGTREIARITRRDRAGYQLCLITVPVKAQRLVQRLKRLRIR